MRRSEAGLIMRFFKGEKNSFTGLSALVLVLVLLFATGALAAERMSVKVSLANVRSGPTTNDEIAWQVTLYHPFTVIEKKGDWYRCRDFEGDSGWLHEKLLSKTPTVITVKDNCNVRKGPSTKDPVLFICDREVPLKVLKHQGRWLKIAHEDGDQGWIHASLVW